MMPNKKPKKLHRAYNINDRFQLLTQDFEGKHQRLLSRDEFNDAVDQVKSARKAVRAATDHQTGSKTCCLHSREPQIGHISYPICKKIWLAKPVKNRYQYSHQLDTA
jgi:hypothetical protein